MDLFGFNFCLDFWGKIEYNDWTELEKKECEYIINIFFPTIKKLLQIFNIN